MKPCRYNVLCETIILFMLCSCTRTELRTEVDSDHLSVLRSEQGMWDRVIRPLFNAYREEGQPLVMERFNFDRYVGLESVEKEIDVISESGQVFMLIVRENSHSSGWITLITPNNRFESNVYQVVEWKPQKAPQYRIAFRRTRRRIRLEWDKLEPLFSAELIVDTPITPALGSSTFYLYCDDNKRISRIAIYQPELRTGSSNAEPQQAFVYILDALGYVGYYYAARNDVRIEPSRRAHIYTSDDVEAGRVAAMREY